jgi:hypothetical protein
MNIRTNWITVIICGLVTLVYGAAQDTATLRQLNQVKQVKSDPSAKPSLPIEARFVSFEGKNFLKITTRAGANFDGELAVQISKWRGSDSKHESTNIRLIKKDGTGYYFETTPNPKVVPDYYVYRMHFPQLYYNIGIYGGNSWREYATYLPGDTVQILNSICDPIVLQCPLKVNEVSDIPPDAKGKIDFIR